MIGNLLHNAGRFTDSGGVVEVHCEIDRARQLAVVRVIDSGVGIEAELLDRLFDPFSQADQDLARSKGGLGLGLALTKGLAELHGGGVTVHSEGAGRGATFTLDIPLHKGECGLATPLPDLSAAVPRLRILVVEDNHDAADTLADSAAARRSRRRGRLRWRRCGQRREALRARRRHLRHRACLGNWMGTAWRGCSGPIPPHRART
jgi:hypothetical protein